MSLEELANAAFGDVLSDFWREKGACLASYPVLRDHNALSRDLVNILGLKSGFVQMVLRMENMCIANIGIAISYIHTKQEIKYPAVDVKEREIARHYNSRVHTLQNLMKLAKCNPQCSVT